MSKVRCHCLSCMQSTCYSKKNRTEDTTSKIINPCSIFDILTTSSFLVPRFSVLFSSPLSQYPSKECSFAFPVPVLKAAPLYHQVVFVGKVEVIMKGKMLPRIIPAYHLPKT